MFGGRSNALKSLINETTDGAMPGAEAQENAFGRVLASLTGSKRPGGSAERAAAADAQAFALPSASAIPASTSGKHALLSKAGGSRQVESKQQRRSRQWEHPPVDGQQKMAARLHALRELALVCQSQVLERSTIVEAWVSCIDLLEHEVRVCEFWALCNSYRRETENERERRALIVSA